MTVGEEGNSAAYAGNNNAVNRISRLAVASIQEGKTKTGHKLKVFWFFVTEKLIQLTWPLS